MTMEADKSQDLQSANQGPRKAGDEFQSEDQKAPDSGTADVSGQVQRQGEKRRKNKNNKKKIPRLKGCQGGGIPSYSGEGQTFVLFRPSSD